MFSRLSSVPRDDHLLFRSGYRLLIVVWSSILVSAVHVVHLKHKLYT